MTNPFDDVGSTSIRAFHDQRIALGARALAADPAVGSVLGVARRLPEWRPDRTEWARADIRSDELVPLLRGAQFTIGASASIFGLLGALVYYGRRSGSHLVTRVGNVVVLYRAKAEPEEPKE